MAPSRAGERLPGEDPGDLRLLEPAELPAIPGAIEDRRLDGTGLEGAALHLGQRLHCRTDGGAEVRPFRVAVLQLLGDVLGPAADPDITVLVGHASVEQHVVELVL